MTKEHDDDEKKGHGRKSSADAPKKPRDKKAEDDAKNKARGAVK